jgi:3'(2'), 5'-bisphosphate nucleotidase
MRRVVKEDLSEATTADVAAQVTCARALERMLGEENVDFVGEETILGGVGGTREDVRALERDVLRACAVVEEIDAEDARAALREQRAPKSPRGKEYWVCDPLDGTKAFVATDDPEKQFVFGLALVDALGAKVAVMIAPKWDSGRGVEVVAVRGRGCFSRSLDDDENDGDKSLGLKRFKRCSVAQPDCVDEARVIISTHEAFEALPLGRAGVAPTNVAKLCCGSLCKYLAVCVGDADIFIQHAKKGDPFVNSWDHAAGVLCAIESGATVSDTEGHPLAFAGSDGDRRKLRPGGGGVIVSSNSIHAEVVRAYTRGLLA